MKNFFTRIAALLMVLISVSLQAQDSPPGYCDVTDLGAGDNVFIESVQFQNINRSSGNLGYLFFKNDTAFLSRQIEQTLTVTLSSTGVVDPSTDGQVTVYIDWNQDGDFDNPVLGVTDERISLVQCAGTGCFSADISIPAGALEGTTIMRVVTQSATEGGANPDPCSTDEANTEVVQDYVISICGLRTEIISNTGDFTSCEDETYQLSTTNTGNFENPLSYLWYTFESTPTINVNPNNNTNATVRVSDNNGCIWNDTVRLIVDRYLPLNAIDADETEMCVQEDAPGGDTAKFRFDDIYETYSWFIAGLDRNFAQVLGSTDSFLYVDDIVDSAWVYAEVGNQCGVLISDTLFIEPIYCAKNTPLLINECRHVTGRTADGSGIHRSYGANEVKQLVLDIPGADRIEYSINDFNTERSNNNNGSLNQGASDILRLGNGAASTAGPVFAGNLNGTIRSNEGDVLMNFDSDADNNRGRGYDMQWTAILDPAITLRLSNTNSRSNNVNNVCEDEDYTITATTVRGEGVDADYRWFINNVEVKTSLSVGENDVAGLEDARKLGPQTFNNGDVVKLQVTGRGGCLIAPGETVVTEEEITLTVLERGEAKIFFDSLFVQDSCAGDVVRYEIDTIEFGGTSPRWYWYYNRNTFNAGVQATRNRQIFTVAADDAVKNASIFTSLRSNYPCVLNHVTGPSAEAGLPRDSAHSETGNFIGIDILRIDSIEISVNGFSKFHPNDGVTIVDTVCAGASVTMTPFTNNLEGTNPTYEWNRSDNPLFPDGTSRSYTTSDIEETDEFELRIISSSPCAICDPDTTFQSIRFVIIEDKEPRILIDVQPNDTLCEGETFNFSAITVNGGPNPAIKWYVNDTVIQNSSSPNFSSAGLTSGDSIYAWLVPEQNSRFCVNPDSAKSETIHITILPISSATLDLRIDNPAACADDSLDFCVHIENNGVNDSLFWYVNNVEVFRGTDTCYRSEPLADGDEVYVSLKIEPGTTCNSDTEVESNRLTILNNTNSIPTAEIEAVPNDTLCSSDIITFNAINVTNGGATPTYRWYLNGVIAQEGADDSYTPATLNDRDTIRLEFIPSNDICVTPDSILTDSIVVVFIDGDDLTALSASRIEVCEETQSAVISLPQNISEYSAIQWQLSLDRINFTDIVGQTDTFLVTDPISDTTYYRALLENFCGPFESDTIALIPVICIQDTVIADCEGTLYDDGGPTENYSDNNNSTFTINPEGANSITITFEEFELQDPDLLGACFDFITISSGFGTGGDILDPTCGADNPGTFTVNDTAVTIAFESSATTNLSGFKITWTTDAGLFNRIALDNHPDSICVGDTAVFRVDSVRGQGMTPNYQWFVNGDSIPGENTLVFDDSTFNDGDVVSFRLISSAESCVGVDTLISNMIAIKVHDTTATTIDIRNTNPNGNVCDGQETVFVADVTGEGNNPMYEWFVNSAAQGVDNDTFRITGLNEGDTVFATLMSDNPCSNMLNATSDSIIIAIKPVEDVTIDNISVQENDTICINDIALFEVTTTNEGDSALITWYVNSSIVQHDTSHQYLTDSLNDRDTVYAVLTPSAEKCATNDFIVSDSIIMSVNPLPIADAGRDTTVCAVGADSVLLEASVMNGKSPYTYQWTNGHLLSDSTVLQPKALVNDSTTFILTVTDSLGCMDNDTVVIDTIGFEIMLGADIQICQGDTVELGNNFTFSGGTGTDTLTYLWGPLVNIDDVDSLMARAYPEANQEYILEVTDSLGCKAVDTVEVEVFFIDIGLDTISFCAGGSVVLGGNPTANSGSGNYTYDWTPAGTLDDPTAANPEATPTDTVTYYLTVTDIDLGCAIDDSIYAAIGENNMFIHAGPDTLELCPDVAVELGGSPTAFGGEEPYEYKWLPNSGLSNGTDENPSVNPGNFNTYTLSVTDNSGCVKVDSVVTVPGDFPRLSISWENLPLHNREFCADADQGFFFTNPPGGELTSSKEAVTQIPQESKIEEVTDITIADNDPRGITLRNTLKPIGGAFSISGILGHELFIDSVCISITHPRISDLRAEIQSPSGKIITLFDRIGIPLSDTGCDGQNIELCIVPGRSIHADYACNPANIPAVSGELSAHGSDDLADFHDGESGGYGDWILRVYDLKTGELGKLNRWSITGRSNRGIFSPDDDNIGVDTIMYSYTDERGCSNTIEDYVEVFELPEAFAGSDSTICPGDCIRLGARSLDDSLSSATGGTPPYNYSWGPNSAVREMFGGSERDDANFCPESRTSYNLTMTVVDSKGCENDDRVRIRLMGLDPGGGPRRQFEICEGESVILGGTPTANDGTEPYRYRWTPAVGFSNLNDTLLSNPLITPKETTRYTLIATDGRFCVDSAFVNVIVNPGPGADAGGVFDVCVFDSVCIGGSPAVFGASEDPDDLVFTWTGPNGYVNMDEENPCLQPFNDEFYVLEVIDDNTDCITRDTAFLNVNPIPEVDAGRSDTLTFCNGNAIRLGGAPTATGSTGPYLFEWLPTDGLNDNTLANPVAEPTASIQYTVTVTDQIGCEGEDEITILVSNPMADAGDDEVLCAGEKVVLGGDPVAENGIAPYSYAWKPEVGLDSTNVANPVASPSVTTAYTLSVSDSTGCVITDVVIITINESPQADAGDNSFICQSDSVELGGEPTVIGGEGPYSYLWTPSSGLSANNVANPKAQPSTTTNYLLRVVDNNGCAALIDSVLVTVTDNLDIELGSDKDICIDATTVTIGAAPAFGTEPYKFAWSPSIGLSANNVQFPQASPRETVTYTLNVVDAFGCPGVDSITVIANESPIVSAGPATITCIGSGTRIGGNPTAIGGTPPYRYDWSPAVTPMGDPNPIASPNQSTNYTVVVTDGKNCLSESVVRVSITEGPTANAGDAPASLCAGEKVSIGAVPPASGGKPPYSFVWFPSTGLNNDAIGRPIASPNETTQYTLKVVDGNNCFDEDEVVVNVETTPVANWDVFTNSDLNVEFRDASIDAQRWFWDFGDGNISNDRNPVYKYELDGSYEVCLTVSRVDNSCESNFCQSIDVEEIIIAVDNRTFDEASVYPNPANEFFVLSASLKQANDIVIEIYDEVGRKVFMTQIDQTTMLNEQIDVSAFSGGLYNVRITANDEYLNIPLSIVR